jgi:hypothetical protein
MKNSMSNTKPASEDKDKQAKTETSQKSAQTPNSDKLGPKSSLFQKNFFKIGAGLAAFIALAGLIYFGVNKLNTPARVKEQVVPTHEYYQEHRQVSDKLIDHLLDDSEISDPEALEREVKKAQDLIEEENQIREKLNSSLDRMTVKQLDTYQQETKSYLDSVATAVTYEQEIADLVEKYVEPFKKMEELSVENSGISNYMYSNPTKYTEKISGYITEQEKMVKQIEDIESGEKYAEIHQSLVEGLKIELQFIKDLKQAIKDRDREVIVQAEQEYTQKTKENDKEYARLNDEVDEEIEDLEDKIKSQARNVESEYSRLRSKYGF